MKQTNGLYPAPLKILDVLRTGCDKVKFIKLNHCTHFAMKLNVEIANLLMPDNLLFYCIRVLPVPKATKLRPRDLVTWRPPQKAKLSLVFSTVKPSARKTNMESQLKGQSKQLLITSLIKIKYYRGSTLRHCCVIVVLCTTRVVHRTIMTSL